MMLSYTHRIRKYILLGIAVSFFIVILVLQQSMGQHIVGVEDLMGSWATEVELIKILLYPLQDFQMYLLSP